MMKPVEKRKSTDGSKKAVVREVRVFKGEVYMGFFPSFISASFIGGLPPPRGGVTGRELFSDGVLAFFSDGFRI